MGVMAGGIRSSVARRLAAALERLPVGRLVLAVPLWLGALRAAWDGTDHASQYGRGDKASGRGSYVSTQPGQRGS
jgi:hypothetical protein